jgi:hypothetical protein
VIANGEASKLPMHWIYYLITSAAGQRVALAFTVESELVERFGTADHVLATNLRFNPPAAATAVKSPQTAAKKSSAAKK